jgi:prepilin-type N-terminal cleavage/methylation domain-containing protein
MDIFTWQPKNPYYLSERNQKGLTLIEITVAVAVFAVVVSAAAAAFVTLGRGTGGAKIRQNVNQTARQIIEQISNEAKFDIGAKDENTGRVYPPFYVKPATANDTSYFDQGSNILVITNTEDGTVKFKAYGIKTAGSRKKLVVIKQDTFPPEDFISNYESTDVTPPDISIEAFDIKFYPDYQKSPNFNWIKWKPACDTDFDGEIEGSDPGKPSFCSNSDNSTQKAKEQPLLEISNLTISSTIDPNAKITLRTSISSRDYDFDN